MPRSTKTSKKKSSKAKRRTMKRRPDLDEGGKPIAAGGFGCVFLPRLKCKDKKRQNLYKFCLYKLSNL